MIDLKVHNKLAPKKGRVLITEPFTDDDYFGRSVILLCDHNEEGTFGFVLNNYIDITINELVEFPEFETRISRGGPVGQNHVYYIHTLGENIPHSTHVYGNIYSGGDFNEIKKLAELGILKPNQVRFFLGYSGWTENQLEGELKHNSWLVSEIINEEDIMDTSKDDLWQNYMEHQGGKYKAFSHFPKNPNLN
jgi:putative transcriptional regulator